MSQTPFTSRGYAGDQYLTSNTLLISLAISLSAGILAISNQSLWIDEGHAIAKASAASFLEFTSMMSVEGGSDAQMPLYMFWLWLWEKVAGPGEWAMRAANLPWLFIGTYALALIGASRSVVWSILASICFAFHPLTWQYLNEARPYIMQMAGACLLLLGVFRSAYFRTQGMNSFRSLDLFISALGAFILCASSMLGVLSLTAFAVALFPPIIFGSNRPKLRITASFIIIIVVTLITFALLGGYFLWTLQKGSRAASIQSDTFSLVVYAIYELVGLSGIGPGRLDIRSNGVSSFLSYAFPTFFCALIILIFGLSTILACLKNKSREQNLCFLSIFFFFTTYFALFVGLSVSSDFRFLGRHLIPAVPVISLLFSAGALILFESRSWFKISVSISTIAMMLLSSFSLRFSHRHAKEDYRQATEVAVSKWNQGQSVMWAADVTTGSYYSSEIRKMIQPTSFTEQAPPSVIILSRPDIYDAQGAIKKLLDTAHYTLVQTVSGFTIYEKHD